MSQIREALCPQMKMHSLLNQIKIKNNILVFEVKGNSICLVMWQYVDFLMKTSYLHTSLGNQGILKFLNDLYMRIYKELVKSWCDIHIDLSKKVI